MRIHFFRWAQREHGFRSACAPAVNHTWNKQNQSDRLDNLRLLGNGLLFFAKGILQVLWIPELRDSCQVVNLLQKSMLVLLTWDRKHDVLHCRRKRGSEGTEETCMAEGCWFGVLVLDRLTRCSYGRGWWSVSAGVVCCCLCSCVWAPLNRSTGSCPIKVHSTDLRNSLSSPSDTSKVLQPDTKYTGTRKRYINIAGYTHTLVYITRWWDKLRESCLPLLDCRR